MEATMAAITGMPGRDESAHDDDGNTITRALKDVIEDETTQVLYKNRSYKIHDPEIPRGALKVVLRHVIARIKAGVTL